MRNIFMSILFLVLSACSSLSIDSPSETVYVANKSLTSITRELTILCRKRAIHRAKCNQYGSQLMTAKSDLLLANEAVLLGAEVDFGDALEIIDQLEAAVRARQ